ncbi:Uma2 family endonuclease [Gemmata sp.]|uniref:Uma2 family endonuclease n=1 Tax=Gemmata sp. TaxID=1914242 RepID=UPI003F6ED38B
MDTVIVTGEQQIDIPAWVVDFESFRRWLESEEFPEQGKVCFIHGKVWVDLSMEEFLSHNMLRTEIGAVLHTLMRQTKFGRFVSEGMRYVHAETELSTEPDGMVISDAALRDGRVHLVGGKKGDQTQVVGSPDIVIEVVSRSSEVKDAEWAMAAYFDAGITEYWVIDGRDEDDLRFDIFKRSKKEFTAARKQGGWVKSAVLERSFRLVLADGERPEFTLEVR